MTLDRSRTVTEQHTATPPQEGGPAAAGPAGQPGKGTRVAGKPAPAAMPKMKLKRDRAAEDAQRTATQGHDRTANDLGAHLARVTDDSLGTIKQGVQQAKATSVTKPAKQLGRTARKQGLGEDADEDLNPGEAEITAAEAAGQVHAAPPPKDKGDKGAGGGIQFKEISDWSKYMPEPLADQDDRERERILKLVKRRVLGDRKQAKAKLEHFRGAQTKQARAVRAMRPGLQGQITAAQRSAQGRVTAAESAQTSAVQAHVAGVRAQVQAAASAQKAQVAGAHGAALGQISAATAAATAKLQESQAQALADIDAAEQAQLQIVAQQFSSTKTAIIGVGADKAGEARALGSSIGLPYEGEKLEAARKAAQDVAGQYADAMPGEASKAADQIGAEQPKTETDVRKVASDMRDAVKKALEQSMQALQQSERQAIAAAGTAMQQSLAAIDQAAAGAVSGLGQLATSQVAAIRQQARAARAGITKQGQSASAGVATACNQAAAGIEGGVQGLVKGAKEIEAPDPEDMNRAVGQGVKELGAGTEGVHTGLTKTASSSAQGIEQAAASAVEGIAQTAAAAKQSATQMGTGAQQTLAKIGQGASQGLTQIAQGHQKVATQVATQAAQGFGQIAKGTRDAYQQVTAGLETSLSGVVQSVRSSFNEAVPAKESEQIREAAQKAADAVKPWWQKALAFVVAIVVAVAVVIVITALIATTGPVGAILVGALAGAAGSVLGQMASNLVLGNNIMQDVTWKTAAIGALGGGLGAGLTAGAGAAAGALATGTGRVAAGATAVRTALQGGQGLAAFGIKAGVEIASDVVADAAAQVIVNGKYEFSVQDLLTTIVTTAATSTPKFEAFSASAGNAVRAAVRLPPVNVNVNTPTAPNGPAPPTPAPTAPPPVPRAPSAPGPTPTTPAPQTRPPGANPSGPAPAPTAPTPTPTGPTPTGPTPTGPTPTGPDPTSPAPDPMGTRPGDDDGDAPPLPPPPATGPRPADPTTTPPVSTDPSGPRPADPMGTRPGDPPATGPRPGEDPLGTRPGDPRPGSGDPMPGDLPGDRPPRAEDGGDGPPRDRSDGPARDDGPTRDGDNDTAPRGDGTPKDSAGGPDKPKDGTPKDGADADRPGTPKDADGDGRPDAPDGPKGEAPKDGAPPPKDDRANDGGDDKGGLDADDPAAAARDADYDELGYPQGTRKMGEDAAAAIEGGKVPHDKVRDTQANQDGLRDLEARLGDPTIDPARLQESRRALADDLRNQPEPTGRLPRDIENTFPQADHVPPRTPDGGPPRGPDGPDVRPPRGADGATPRGPDLDGPGPRSDGPTPDGASTPGPGAVTTDVSMHTGGGRDPAAIQRFTDAIRPLQDSWRGMSPDERIGALRQALSDHFAAQGIYEPSIVAGDCGPNNGVFRASTWEIVISQAAINNPNADVAAVAGTAYHEGRHAEQTFAIARDRAHGMSPDAVAAQLHIDLDVARAAQASLATHPMTPEEIRLADALQRDVPNRGPAYRELDLSRNRLDATWTVWVMVRDNPASTPGQRAQTWNDYQQARARYDAAYQAYRNLVNEADAFEAGDAVRDALRPPPDDAATPPFGIPVGGRPGPGPETTQPLPVPPGTQPPPRGPQPPPAGTRPGDTTPGGPGPSGTPPVRDPDATDPFGMPPVRDPDATPPMGIPLGNQPDTTPATTTPPPRHDGNTMPSAPDPIDVYAQQHNLPPETAAALRAAGVRPETLDGLVALGMDPRGVADLAARFGNDGAAVATAFHGRGIPPADALTAAIHAGETGLLGPARVLAEAPTVRNPGDLPNLLLRIARGNRGDARAVEDAARRAAQGHDLEVDAGRGDVVDYTANETVQHKDLNGTGAGAFFTRLREAAKQIRGETGEVPPPGHSGTAHITLSNSGHAFYNADRATLSERLRNTPGLEGVDTFRITNGNGTFDFHPPDFL